MTSLTPTFTLPARLPRTSWGQDLFEARMAAEQAADEALRQLAAEIDALDDTIDVEPLAPVIDLDTERARRRHLPQDAA